MFNEAFQGTYKNKVKWFAGVADNVVHVTLSDMDGGTVFYDYMLHVHGREQFEIELSKMCEHYISRFIDVVPVGLLNE